VAVLVAAGQGPLASPGWDDFGRWVDERGAAVAAVALLRLAALAAAGWLLAASAVRAVAEAAGVARLAALAEAAMPPAVRRVCAGLAGAGVAGAALVGVADPPRAGAAASPAMVHMVVVATADPLVPGTPPPVVDPSPVPDSPTVSMSIAGAEAVEPPSTGTWVVEPGDSFWSIADEIVTDRLGRAPSDAEVAAYWSVLVAANADRLVTGDPDVIYPGQQLLLPG
jgi:nucleoid-associated protein YgaU